MPCSDSSRSLVAIDALEKERDKALLISKVSYRRDLVAAIPDVPSRPPECALANAITTTVIEEIRQRHAHDLSAPSLCAFCISVSTFLMKGSYLSAYQSLHCTVESMSVVSSELWIGTLQRWIS